MYSEEEVMKRVEEVSQGVYKKKKPALRNV